MKELLIDFCTACAPLKATVVEDVKSFLIICYAKPMPLPSMLYEWDYVKSFTTLELYVVNKRVTAVSKLEEMIRSYNGTVMLPL